MKPKTIEEIAAERGQSVDLVQQADDIARSLGGPGFVASHNQGVCALCGKSVDVATGFRDELSRREYAITRSCQGCQDEIFQESDDDD